MTKLNLTKFIIIVLFLSSCGSVFKNPKKDNSDEFLIEKKMPLKMPPAFNKLPVPGEKNQAKNNEIKSLISKSENSTNEKSKSEEVSQDTKDSLLEKIKKN
ncbi:DUF3035 domain-containing protein [Candidatus Pelagibacter sp.]|nr:DUF3035 domain-containing protein [Candidatus Pelagibacter sp.]